MIWIYVLTFLAGVLTGSLVFGDWDDEGEIVVPQSSIRAAIERQEREG